MRPTSSNQPDFHTLLAQSRRMLLDAYAHQQVPFEQIVERLQPARNAGHSPLFQVMLVLQNNEQGTLALPGLTLGSAGQGAPVAKFDLTLTVTEDDTGLALGWNYNTDLFEAETIARMAAHFDILLAGLVSDPACEVFAVPMLAEAECRRQLVEWNNTASDYPRDASIGAVFEEQVRRNPDAVALEFDGRQMTYGELNARANRLARYLAEQRQVGPDILVGMCVERSFEMLVTTLAIVKAGGAYLPLDPGYPQARLAYMVEDAQLSTVLVQSHLRERVPLPDSQVLCVDDAQFQQQLAALPATDFPVAGLEPRHLAYEIYTSGSTGNPKGVMVGHGAVVSLVVGENYADLSPSTVMLQGAPVAFDAATFEIWGALLNGGKLVLPGVAQLDMEQLGRFIGAHGITTAWMTAGLFEQFAAAYEQPLPQLRQLLAGGDVVNQHAVALVRSRNPGLAVINGYGPTENTTFSCTYRVRDDGSVHTSLPIGTPLNNRTAYVLNASGQLAPVGVAGELYVGGAGLARGYLRRPDLTQEKFVPHPFVPGESLYRTGDLVRRLADGNIEFLARIDQQVKIRGFRIELGEIEHALGAHAQVREAVVLARAAGNGDKRLVAYVVTHGAVADEAELQGKLRSLLAQSLPDYMVPAVFMLLERLPLTPNGKVDRKALPEPDMAAVRQVYVAPRTQAEEVVCELWQELLGVEQVGVTDNFFALGGHSLLAVRFVSRLRQRLGVELPLRVLFATASAQDVASAIGANAAASRYPNLVPVRPQGEAGATPLFLIHPGEGEACRHPVSWTAKRPCRACPRWPRCTCRRCATCSRRDRTGLPDGRRAAPSRTRWRASWARRARRSPSLA
jgi:amino acid adenylation domain-containing protein